ncbi:MAG: hypothetical protein JWQ20_2139 [Conexibacter sp.]|nr:hypothetical protein [Conexibacter sp.]
MQIALVAVVLLAGMWFTVLKPKPDAGVSAPPATAAPVADASSAPVAPGVKGLTTAVDKAKDAASASDAANARVEAATAGAPAAKPAAAKAVATKRATTKAKATKSVVAARKPGAKAAPAVAPKPAAPAAIVDPSDRLLAYLAKGKTLVILFHGDGADDAAARKAVHRTALKDKNVVSAYVPITKVGAYQAITSGVDVLTSPTVMIIGTDHKATSLTGFIEAASVKQAVGDARRAAAAGKK